MFRDLALCFHVNYQLCKSIRKGKVKQVYLYDNGYHDTNMLQMRIVSIVPLLWFKLK